MTHRERINAAAWQAIRNEIHVETEPGYCLKLVRQVLEHAFDWPSHRLYARYVTEWVQPPSYDRMGGHWARDAERSLRNRGMTIPNDAAEPGDLVFNWRAAWSDRWGAYIGHVGILMDHHMVLENVNPAYRMRSLSRGAVVLTPVSQWAEPTTTIRFEP